MILVTGATGTIGRHLSKHLQGRGAPFKAMVRSEAKGAALGCDYRLGDFDEPTSLVAAMEGIDTLFLNSPGGEILLRHQTAAIEAARRAGVRRIVKISSRGADASSQMPIARSHGLTEKLLAEAGLSWAVLRPGTFMQNLLRNATIVRSESKIYGAYKNGRISFIDAEDIAACAAELLLSDRHEGATYTLSGPEALSFAAIAEKLSAVLGKLVTYVDLPPEQMVEVLKSNGMPPPFAEMMVRLMVVFSSGDAAHVTPAVEEISGRPARGLDVFLAENAAVFR
ncbi:MAG: SDR family oxidoreductase [Polyangiaceae bacterium]|nr:SDR family oxidoreductase [Polyangiaceae bacterium]